MGSLDGKDMIEDKKKTPPFGSCDRPEGGGYLAIGVAVVVGWLSRETRIRGQGYIRHSDFFYLLGIHWGQFPEEWEIRDRREVSSEARHLDGNERYVQGMSGMTCAIPAWEIREVLDIDELILGP